ncbi:MAG TPA: ribbon-helix-helix domain-containing protein [bacterium]|jgi:hypothetical protein|nr:ribbon-helix-helix domain-containing protein [bacterium]
MNKKKKRTIISLDAEDKHWLDQKAKETHQTMTQVVREAVAEYRAKSEKKLSFKELLDQTSGIWPHSEDALEYVRKIREEWR